MLRRGQLADVLQGNLPLPQEHFVMPKSMLATFYTKFQLVRDANGYHIFGAFNTGDYYQFAFVTVQTKLI